MKHFVLIAMMGLAFGLSACKEDKTKSETTEISETEDGTVIETKTKTETTVDEDGVRSRTYETETTVDPEGMLNKETVEETKTEENNL